MTTTTVLLIVALCLVVAVCAYLGYKLWYVARERDTAQYNLTLYHRQWRNMRHYLTERYQNSRDVSQDGMELFFTGRGSNYNRWIEWITTNSPPVDDGEW